MTIRQMILTLTVEKTAHKGEGEPYNYYHNIDIDLTKDSIADFLAQIPDDINEHSSIMLAIRREDGEMISFVDGIMPESQGEGWGAMKRISEIENGKHAEDLRFTAKLFAQRRFMAMHLNGQDALQGTTKPNIEANGLLAVQVEDEK